MGILDAIRSPARGMREASGRGAKPGLVVIVLWVVVSLLASGLGLILGGFTPPEEIIDSLPPGSVPAELDEQSLERFITGFQVFGIGLRVFWPFLYWPVLTLVMHLITRFFGGEGALSGMFGAMGVACVPFVISGLLQLPIIGAQAALNGGSVSQALGLAGGLLNVAFVIWHVVLAVIGAAVARQLSYGRSSGSCAISCATVIGVPILLLLVLAVVLAVAGGGGG